MKRSTTIAAAVVGALCLGCNPPDLDEDGDGFTELTNDCDDSDPNVHPDAVEVCGNDKDDNCNGELDELGATSGRIWYADLDGDGFGDEGLTIEACAQPEGYAANKWDCNESDASIHPDADEICDAVDNDCDGQIDESNAVDALIWYPDRDGDGYGDETLAVTACEAPEGHIEVAGDCVDLDPLTHPGMLEDCRTVGDDDCDGTPNSQDAEAIGCTDFYADLDGDGYAGSAECLCEAADPWLETEAPDCDDTNIAVYPGAPSTRRWRSEDCEDDTSIDVETVDRDLRDLWNFGGYYLTGGRYLHVVDANLDGASDLLVRGWGHNPVLIPGPLDTVTADDIVELSLPQGEGSEVSPEVMVSLVDDVDGDGLRDVLSPRLFSSGEYDNGVYLFSQADAVAGTLDYEDALDVFKVKIQGWPMAELVAEDLRGDESIEFIGTGYDGQTVFGVVHPRQDPLIPAEDWNTDQLNIQGSGGSCQPAFADVDGDGISELLLGRGSGGDPNNWTLGRWGSLKGSLMVFEIIDEPEEKAFLPRKVFFGQENPQNSAIAGLGGLGIAATDVNGDGHADIVAGDHSQLLEPDGWQIVVFEGPVLDDSAGLAWEIAWNADIRVSGNEGNKLGLFDVLPDIDQDGASDLVAYGSNEGPWYIHRLEEGHHRIDEVGRRLTTGPEGYPVRRAHGVLDVNGDGTPEALLETWQDASYYFPLLVYGDTP